MERVARRGGTRRRSEPAPATATLGVRETASVPAGALAFLERVTHGGASASAASAASAAFGVRKPALVASGALAFLEGVADRARAWAFSEPSLLRVLALSAPRGLVLPPLALVELLFAAGEDELGVAIAAVQSDVLPLLRQRVGVRGAFGVDLEPVLFVAVLGGFLFWGYNVWGVEGTGLGWVYIGCIFLRALQ